MQDEIVISGSCRRCAEKVQATATKEPVYRCVAQCARCQYFTVIRDDPLDLPLVESFQPFFSEVELDAVLSRSDDLAAACLELLEKSAARAVEFAEVDRPVVVSGLLHLINQAEKQLNELFNDPQYINMKGNNAHIDVAIASALYCALSEKHAIVLPKELISITEANRVIGARLVPLLSSVVGIAKQILPRIYDGTIHFRWENRKLRAEKLLHHNLLVEAGINRLQAEEREKNAGAPVIDDTAALSNAILSHSVQDAVEICTGIEISILIELLQNRMQALVDHGVATRPGDIVMIASSRLNSESYALFEQLTFTVDRVRQFSTPHFFDSGRLREEPLSPGATVIEAAAVNWSAYYPCFIMNSPGTGEPIFVTTPRLWQTMLLTLAQRPASLMQSLHEMLVRTEPASARLTALRELIRKTHQELETSVLKLATEVGWKGLAGVEKVNKKPLPCGEIDVLATALVGERRVLLVAEVKDSDSPMFLPGSLERTTALISHAEDQLEKKGVWVMNNWPQALALLDVKADPPARQRFLARLVVTRRPLGAHFFKKFPGSSTVGFQSIARDLLRGDDSVWASPWRVHVQEVMP